MLDAHGPCGSIAARYSPTIRSEVAIALLWIPAEVDSEQRLPTVTLEDRITFGKPLPTDLGIRALVERKRLAQCGEHGSSFASTRASTEPAPSV